jgi:hypothetical protein
MFDICTTRPREAAGREQMEQPLQRRSGYVNEMAFSRTTWMVQNFEEARGPWMEKGLLLGR